ncbi:LOW QUALITY PROTEIN: RNA polymerase II C-terminal domain phosphatase-like 4 [Curcuma longa]|uniref:LOW QUALITY PROTEIN: RNA polymerase II C-terminal domain phosphatase-like 4 n=1 Tax=Curcuma longa TaxID=136217 RepID=UPI003D9DC7BF
MSLAAESPLQSSSSGEDFAAFLDSELELASSESSPNEENVKNGKEIDLQEHRSKRQKLEGFETLEDLETETLIEPIEEHIGTSTPGKYVICPPHPGFFKGLCIRCGQVEEDGSGVAFGYIHKDLRLGNVEIERLRGADLKNLLHKKKLILILDLDHTLLNSTRFADITSDEEYLFRQIDGMKDDPDRSLFRLDTMHMLTKLRPFVHNFLKEASSFFEMYIYTMAERSYAMEIAKLLDPDKVYFDSKVITQADCTQRHQKGLDVILGAESLVVILDDTEAVWHRHKDNLIQMERYHFFASSCRQFGFNAKSLSQLMKDERESDGALATVLEILKRTHRMFFDPDIASEVSTRDVRPLLKGIRQEILQGCRIVFSRVFPSKSPAQDHPIWKMAERLGATCYTEVDPSVTHVVSTDTGTQKAHWATQNKKFLVSPHWIEASNFLWHRQKEEDFLISNPRSRNG